MRVLVTGGAGFIGRRLLRRLIESEHEVTAFVRASDIPEALKETVRTYRGDLRSPIDVESSVKDQDMVIHLAAALDHLSGTSRLYQEVNVEGIKNLLRGLRHTPGTRLIHLSSVGVHGPIRKPPADEAAPFNPTTTYERSKAQAESLVHQEINGRGLSAIILRPAIVYGEGDIHSAIYRMFRAIAKRRYRHIGKGKWQIHMVHVDDIVEGIMAGIGAEEARGQAFILAGSEPTTIKEVASAIARALGTRIPDRGLSVGGAVAIATPLTALKKLGVIVPLSLQSVRFLTSHHAYSIAKARAELGYEPQIGLDTGVQRTAEWYRVQGYIDN